jgi:hypothetical protein
MAGIPGLHVDQKNAFKCGFLVEIWRQIPTFCFYKQCCRHFSGSTNYDLTLEAQ